MQVTIGKLISLVITLAYLITVFTTGISAAHSSRILIGTIVGEALILFPEELGSITGVSYGGRTVNKETPGCMVAAMGWVLLLVIVPTYYLVIARGAETP